MGKTGFKPEDSAPEVQFSVLENGLDFLVTSLSHLQGDPSPRDLKYAVLHLSAGIELVLKDRLRREHWSLVFGDINKADAKAYATGDFYSVDLKDCITRLTSICNAHISDSDKIAVLNLKGKRTRLEHFAAIDSSEAINASTAAVLSFAVDFIAAEFELTSSEKAESDLLNQIRSKLPEFKQFVAARLDQIRPELEAVESPIVECPRCVQEAMHFSDGAKCSFCGYSAEGETAAGDYAYSLFGMGWKYVADGGVIPVYRCSECWREAFVDVGSLKQDFESERLVCFSCGYSLSWDQSEFCVKCGSPFSKRADELPVCTNCYP